MTTQVNLYRSNGKWCFAAWIGREFDCSDTVGCANNADYEDVVRYMESIGLYENAVYTQVADID